MHVSMWGYLSSVMCVIGVYCACFLRCSSLSSLCIFFLQGITGLPGLSGLKGEQGDSGPPGKVRTCFIY